MYMRAVCLATLVGVVSSYMYFQDLIPNGDRVPNPCGPNGQWPGVGHQARSGGGYRNSFGKAFGINGYKWNESLCLADSDGDGRTNGEELGDADCRWTSKADNDLLMSTNLSHPGVCEPLEDARCMAVNDFDVCVGQGDPVCDADGDPDVIELNLTLTEGQVPGQVTTHVCQFFDIPTDTDYHLVGYAAIIDNADVVHHMLLSACDPTVEQSDNMEPRECSWPYNSCDSRITGWAYGNGPMCWNSKDYGFPLGKGSTRRVMLEVHWNNPEMRTDYTDASGLKLYLTRRLKANDMGLTYVATDLLELPPGQPAVAQQAHCRAECTENLPHDIFLVGGVAHMHLLGSSMNIELYHNGVKRADVYYVSHVYNDPSANMFELDEAVQVKRGDEIRVTCVYDTSLQTKTVKYGTSTSDEMCIAYFKYYPAVDNMQKCHSFGDLDICEKPGRALYEYEGCNVGQYVAVESLNSTAAQDVMAECDPSWEECRPKCQEAISALKTHPCEQGDYGKLVETLYLETSRGRSLVASLHSCDEQVGGTHDTKNKKKENSGNNVKKINDQN